MGIRRALIIPDCHRPFHDRRAYDLMLEAAVYLGLDEVVLLGDFADFYSVSRHQKHPKVDTLLTEEVLSVNQGLDQLDSLFPEAKKAFLEGNHEKRLESYLVDKAPGLFGVTDVRYLFELNRRPLWSFQEFGRTQAYQVLGTDLYTFHRPLSSNPKLHIERVGVSSVYGDIHKIQRSHYVGLDGKHRIAVCPGWLGDVSSRVFDYMPSTPQWQLGFVTVEVDDASNEYFINQHEIKNHIVYVNGKRFG